MDNLSGWWLNPTPPKNMNVNWEDEIPNLMERNNVPNHQPDIYSSIDHGI